MQTIYVYTSASRRIYVAETSQENQYSRFSLTKMLSGFYNANYETKNSSTFITSRGVGGGGGAPPSSDPPLRTPMKLCIHFLQLLFSNILQSWTVVAFFTPEEPE